MSSTHDRGTTWLALLLIQCYQVLISLLCPPCLTFLSGTSSFPNPKGNALDSFYFSSCSLQLHPFLSVNICIWEREPIPYHQLITGEPSISSAIRTHAASCLTMLAFQKLFSHSSTSNSLPILLNSKSP